MEYSLIELPTDGIVYLLSYKGYFSIISNLALTANRFAYIIRDNKLTIASAHVSLLDCPRVIEWSLPNGVRHGFYIREDSKCYFSEEYHFGKLDGEQVEVKLQDNTTFHKINTYNNGKKVNSFEIVKYPNNITYICCKKNEKEKSYRIITHGDEIKSVDGFWGNMYVNPSIYTIKRPYWPENAELNTLSDWVVSKF